VIANAAPLEQPVIDRLSQSLIMGLREACSGNWLSISSPTDPAGEAQFGARIGDRR
jgi:hypothetical protein